MFPEGSAYTVTHFYDFSPSSPSVLTSLVSTALLSMGHCISQLLVGAQSRLGDFGEHEAPFFGGLTPLLPSGSLSLLPGWSL